MPHRLKPASYLALVMLLIFAVGIILGTGLRIVVDAIAEGKANPVKPEEK